MPPCATSARPEEHCALQDVPLETPLQALSGGLHACLCNIIQAQEHSELQDIPLETPLQAPPGELHASLCNISQT